jgi:hypothetical protein
LEDIFRMADFPSFSNNQRRVQSNIADVNANARKMNPALGVPLGLLANVANVADAAVTGTATLAKDIVTAPFRGDSGTETALGAIGSKAGNPSSPLGPNAQGVVTDAAKRGVERGFNPVTDALRGKK